MEKDIFMALGAGYWVSPDNQIERVGEHATEVRTNPEHFGLRAEDLPPREHPDRRRVTVLLAMRRGWMRIRQDSGRQGTQWNVEFVKLPGWSVLDKVFDVLAVAQEVGLGRYTVIRINVMDSEGNLLSSATLNFQELVDSLAPGGDDSVLERQFGERVAESRLDRRTRVAKYMVAKQYLEEL